MMYRTNNSPKGLERIDRAHPHAEALIDFYEGRGFEHARDEAHAHELAERGIPCILVQEGSTSE